MFLPSLLAQNNIDIDFGQTAQREGIDLPYAKAGSTGLGDFVGTILSGLIGIAAVIVLVYLIWGAFDWISSGNEKGKIDSARNKMTGAVIGLFVLVSVLVIFGLVQQFTGIKIFIFT